MNMFRYYTVEESTDSSCLNYKSIRHYFEEYDLADFEPPPPKVGISTIIAMRESKQDEV